MKNPKSTAFLLCAALLSWTHFGALAGIFDGDQQNSQEKQSKKTTPPVKASAHHSKFNPNVRPNPGPYTPPSPQNLTPPDIVTEISDIQGVGVPSDAPPILGPAQIPTPPQNTQQAVDVHAILKNIAEWPSMKLYAQHSPDLFKNPPDAKKREKAGEILWKLNVKAYEQAIREPLSPDKEGCYVKRSEAEKFDRIKNNVIVDDIKEHAKKNDPEDALWATLVPTVETLLDEQIKNIAMTKDLPALDSPNGKLSLERLKATQLEKDWADIQKMAKDLAKAIQMRNMDDHLWAYTQSELTTHLNLYVLKLRLLKNDKNMATLSPEDLKNEEDAAWQDFNKPSGEHNPWLIQESHRATCRAYHQDAQNALLLRENSYNQTASVNK